MAYALTPRGSIVTQDLTPLSRRVTISDLSAQPYQITDAVCTMLREHNVNVFVMRKPRSIEVCSLVIHVSVLIVSRRVANQWLNGCRSEGHLGEGDEVGGCGVRCPAQHHLSVVNTCLKKL